jgi:hypothetical protein
MTALSFPIAPPSLTVRTTFIRRHCLPRRPLPCNSARSRRSPQRAGGNDRGYAYPHRGLAYRHLVIGNAQGHIRGSADQAVTIIGRHGRGLYGGVMSPGPGDVVPLGQGRHASGPNVGDPQELIAGVENPGRRRPAEVPRNDLPAGHGVVDHEVTFVSPESRNRHERRKSSGLRPQHVHDSAGVGPLVTSRVLSKVASCNVGVSGCARSRQARPTPHQIA